MIIYYFNLKLAHLYSSIKIMNPLLLQIISLSSINATSLRFVLGFLFNTHSKTDM